MRSVLKEEFLLRNFGLGFHVPEAFCQAQWRWPRMVFVLYRLVMSGYSIYALTDVLVNTSENSHFILVYLTIWTYITETVFFFLGAIVAILYVCCPRLINAQSTSQQRNAEQIGLKESTKNGKNSGDGGGLHNAGYSGDLDTGTIPTRKCEAGMDSPTDLEAGGKSDEPSGPPGMPWYVQCFWILSNVIQVFPFIVTVIYFSALYNARLGLSLQDMNVHGVNSILVLIDIAVCARPVRLLHVVYSILFGLAYVVFSIIYWSIDKENNVLYEIILDWNKPGIPVAVVISLSVVGIPLLQLANFGLFKLRLYLYLKIYGDRYL